MECPKCGCKMTKLGINYVDERKLSKTYLIDVCWDYQKCGGTIYPQELLNELEGNYGQFSYYSS